MAVKVQAMRKTPVVLTMLLLSSSPAWAQDQQLRSLCYGADASADEAIAACTSLIALDLAKPSDQAKNYANRAFAYRLKHQAGPALADANRAISDVQAAIASSAEASAP
jgi:hypothetical protein